MYEKADVSDAEGLTPCPPPILAGGGHQSPYGVCIFPRPPFACAATLAICALTAARISEALYAVMSSADFHIW